RSAGAVRRPPSRRAPDGRFDCLDDLHVAGAAADVPRQGLLDLSAVGLRRALDERLGGEQEAGCTEAALGAVVLMERRLHGRTVLRGSETFDGRDRRAVDRCEREQARPPRLAVHQHRAGAAAALLATGLGAGDPELLAEDVEQRAQPVALDLVADAV